MTELLGLIARLNEGLPNVGEAIEDWGVVQRFLTVEDLLSDHGVPPVGE